MGDSGPVPTTTHPTSAALRSYVSREARVWGGRVQSRRKAIKLSLEDVAELAHTSKQTISRIEHGDLVPRDYMRLAIAFALQCEPAELFPLPTRQAVLRDVA